MFTEKEIDNLKKISSRKFKIFIYTGLAIGLCAMSLSCISNFIISHNYAQRIDMSLYDIFNVWVHGFNVSNTYSGIYCIAFEKFVSALFDLYLTGLLFLIIPIYKITIRKNQKIAQLYATKNCA